MLLSELMRCDQGYLTLATQPITLRTRLHPWRGFRQFPESIPGDEEGLREWFLQVCGLSV